VFRVRIDGTHLRQLTHNPDGSDEPTFSPNGKRIAFDRIGNNHGGIFTMRPNGTHLHQLRSGVGVPDFSPNGKRILCETRQISIMRSDGSHLHSLHLGRSAVEPAFSPNGKRITYDTDHRGLFTTRVTNGSHRRRLTSNGHPYLPSWQPLP
jgi:Tol biopolymer transport system component